MISKLKEQYKKERKGKKGVKSKWERNLCVSPPHARAPCFPTTSHSSSCLLLTSFLLTVFQGLKLRDSCLTMNLKITYEYGILTNMSRFGRMSPVHLNSDELAFGELCAHSKGCLFLVAIYKSYLIQFASSPPK